jgi:hypothetical protein
LHTPAFFRLAARIASLSGEMDRAEGMTVTGTLRLLNGDWRAAGLLVPSPEQSALGWVVQSTEYVCTVVGARAGTFAERVLVRGSEFARGN